MAAIPTGVVEVVRLFRARSFERARLRLRAARAAGDHAAMISWRARLRHRARDLRAVQARCGEAAGAALCVSCGLVHPVPVRCRLPWCADCERARTGRAKRIGAAGWTAIRSSLPDRFRPVMLTLTVPHLGNTAARFHALRLGWPRLRSWLRLACGAAPYYYAGLQCTAGGDGNGHPHLHVTTAWPWFSWRELHEEWRRAVPGAKVLDVQTFPAGDGGRAAMAAARYAARYAVRPDDRLDADGWAAVLAETLGRRLVLASRGWTRIADTVLSHQCPACHERAWKWEPARLASPAGGGVNVPLTSQQPETSPCPTRPTA